MLQSREGFPIPINCRPATWNDIELGLSFQPKHRGGALVCEKAALEAWRQVVRNPFFLSAVLEDAPSGRGPWPIGFAAAVFVNRTFADAEILNPSPDINSRIIASIHSGRSVLATKRQVAQANAQEGVEVMVMCGGWPSKILTLSEAQEVQTILPTSFAAKLAGYRVHRICWESSSESESQFAQSSLVYQVIAEFPELGRVTHLMSLESARAIPASLGNSIFNYREPLLRLRASDQQLLLAALDGATDTELASEIGVTLFAVKARWRATIARVEETMPDLVRDVVNYEGRGAQKRHRVLAYVRSHPEELRPFDWAKTNLA